MRITAEIYKEAAKNAQYVLGQAYNGVLQRFSYAIGVNLAKPHVITLCLTDRCNLKCTHCRTSNAARKAPEMPTSQIKQGILEMRRVLGNYFFSITGGEPLVRKDCAEIIRFAVDQGLLVNVLTNGILMTPEWLSGIEGHMPHSFIVSIDGSSERTHDKIRGKGSFRAAIKNLRYLHKHYPDVKIILVCTILGSNISELASLVRMVKREGFYGINFQCLERIPKDRPGSVCGCDIDKMVALPNWPHDTAGMNSALEEIISMKKRGEPILNPLKHLLLMRDYYNEPLRDFSFVKCLQGVCHLWISPVGELIMCIDEKRSIGKFGDGRLREALNSTLASDERGRIKSCRKPCRLSLCNFRDESLLEKALRSAQFFINNLRR